MTSIESQTKLHEEYTRIVGPIGTKKFHEPFYNSLEKIDRGERVEEINCLGMQRGTFPKLTKSERSLILEIQRRAFKKNEELKNGGGLEECIALPGERVEDDRVQY